MRISLLRRLLPKKKDDALLARLRELAQKSPELGNAVLMYEAILPVLLHADIPIPPAALSPAQARAKMERGAPLLVDIDLAFDVDAVREHLLLLAKAVETARKPTKPGLRATASRKTGSAARNIRLALEENRLAVADVLSSVSMRDRGPIAAVAHNLQLDRDLLRALAQNALKPLLQAWRRQLTPYVEGITWNQGTCYVCGADASFAELQENDQVKHLRCGSCGADWKYPRLRCARCGNEDHHTQQYFTAEGKQGAARVETCDACKGYLKVISSFTPAPPLLLPIEDLATVHLDYLAQERGYRNPGQAR